MKEDDNSVDISSGMPTESVTGKDGTIVKEKDDSSNHLSATVSIAQGNEIAGDYGAESELKRSLSTRHMTMIALGSSIGMGLWLGAGKSLVNGGPVALFLAYVIAGTMVWCVSHSIGELAVMYPVPSALVQWSAKFVGKPAGFSLGWAYWCSYMLTIGNELTAANTVLRFWTTAMPLAGWITILWAVVAAVNIGAVTIFGEIEVVMSTIKFSWIFVVIVASIVISAGGAPQGDAIGFRYWAEMPFTNGFKGFVSVLPTGIFAMSGSENCSYVASECENPRQAVPKAVGSIWLRLGLFYLIGSLMVTITVSPKNEDVFGGTGTNASPYVVAFRDAGLPALAHCMNAVIFLSVLSTGTISGYAGSRTTVGLAQLGMAPKIFARTDKIGRPWAGLVLTITLGGALAYMNTAESGLTVFTWLSNLSSLFTLFGWGLICLSNIRMRAAWKLQGRTVEELPWKSWAFPYGAWWGLIWCIILAVLEFYLAVSPLNATPSVENFFANYSSVVLIIVIFIGAKFYFRSPWMIPLKDIDLDEGRRFYQSDDVEKEVEKPKGFAAKAAHVAGKAFM